MAFDPATSPPARVARAIVPHRDDRDDVTPETILEFLTDVGFLRRTGRDAYLRADTG
jgi:hypothetical protein